MATPDARDLRSDADLTSLSEAIRRRRKDLALTQEDLATLAGVGTRLVHEVERGATTTRVDSLLRLLAVLGLHLELRPGTSPDVVVSL